MTIRNLMAVLSMAAGLAAACADAGAAASLPAIRAASGNQVPACVTPDRLMAYLRTRNAGLDARFADIAGHYMRQGEELRLRWDVAFFQMMVDTANLSFRRSNGEAGAVRPAQNNFAGLGATGGGVAGESFADVATGVKAHLQHVLLYAGETIAAPVAERTRKVQDWGILASWQRNLPGPVSFDDLARRWSPADASYGAGIAAVTRRFYDGFCNRNDAVAREPAAATDREPETAPAAVSGIELARQANERARSEGDGARSALGVTIYEDARAEPVIGPLLMLPRLVTARSYDGNRAFGRDFGRETGRETAIGGTEIAPAALPVALPLPANPVVEAPKVAAIPPPQVDPVADAIRNLIVGRTFVIDAAFGATIPIYFRADGSMRGSAGSLASLLGASTDEGRWWVTRGRLCTRWKVWLDKGTQCIKLRQAGQTIHWVRDDGKSGTARLASR